MYSTAEGLEECRKCCGGHGVMLVFIMYRGVQASGVAQMAMDYVTYCTAEGDRIVLELQTARYLVKSLRQALVGVHPAGACDYQSNLGYWYMKVLVNNPTFDVRSTKCQWNDLQQFQDLNNLQQLFRQRALTLH